MRTALTFLLLLIAAAPPSSARPTEGRQEESAKTASWRVEEVGVGVVWKRYHFKSFDGKKQSINVIDVDLRNKNVRVRFARAKGRERTGVIASRTKAVAAVNGGYFNSKGNPVGLLRIDGKTLATNVGERWASIGIDAKERIVILRGPKGDWKTVSHAMGAGPILVQGGKIDVGSGFAHEKGRHPRTIVGLTRRNHLLLVTVDGRTPSSAGMNCRQLAQLMIDLGCVSALNLDGGGSTAMWVRGEPDKGIVSNPSDNRKFDHAGERAVSNVVLILAPDVIVGEEDEAKLTPSEGWIQSMGRDYVYTKSAGATARWTLRVDLPGTYVISVRWPKGRNAGRKAVLRYDGKEITLDPRKGRGKWKRLATIQVDRPRDIVLELESSVIDAVRLSQN